jgi:hypothetical protein
MIPQVKNRTVGLRLTDAEISDIETLQARSRYPVTLSTVIRDLIRKGLEAELCAEASGPKPGNGRKAPAQAGQK